MGGRSVGRGCITAAVLGLSVASGLAPGAGGELPEPLTLSAALELLPEGLPAETLAGEYQETAILSRAFECRAQDRLVTTAWGSGRGCGYWHLLAPAQQTRLEVLSRFLDVVEADFTAGVDDEAMAVAYVELDRARNREALGQYSSLDVAELDQGYQRVRSHRALAQALQRATRARLAIALGRPGDLPAEVQAPELPPLPDQLADVDRLTTDALSGNPVLKAWKERADPDPLTEPLLRELELHLREAVLDLWLSYPVIRAELDADVAREAYRETYLDRSRTLYELEVKADLGDAMTEQTAARLARMKTSHRAQLLLATLNELLGKSNALQPTHEGPSS